MATVTVFLRTDYKKDDETYPVYLSFRLPSGKRLRINTGVMCHADSWNDAKRIIKGRSEEIKEKNLIITNDVAFITDIFVRYKLNHQILTEELFQREWENRAASADFIVYLSNKMDERLRQNDIAKSTYTNHKRLIVDLKAFKSPIPFFDLSISFFKDFRVYLASSAVKNSVNTIDKKFRQLHGYIEDAIKDKLIDHNPLSLIDKQVEAVAVSYLDESDLTKLFELYRKANISPLHKSILRRFLFACISGLRISDVISMTTDDLKNGYIVILMTKTARTSGRSTRIPITKSLQSLLTDANPNNEIGLIFKDRIAEPVINRELKYIARMAQINKNICFKTGRHTFGYLYYKKTKDLLALKSLMGHSKIEQTLVYAHLNDEDVITGMATFDSFTE